MTLERLADGSHTYLPPNQPYVPAGDPLGRTAAPSTPGIGVQPLVAARFSHPARVKDHRMQGYEVYSFQVQLMDIGGTWRQFGEGMGADYAETEWVGEGPERARHPFAIGQEASASGTWINPANTTTILQRMSWANFAGRMYATMGTLGGATVDPPVMFGETSSSNPSMQAIAGYAPLGADKQLACMTPILCGPPGAVTSYLFIGYAQNAGLTGCEAFDDFTGAPLAVDVSNGHALTGGSAYGIIQSPNGDILLAAANGDLRLAKNNLAPNNLIFDTIQAQGLGILPYAVGGVSLSNYGPGALWWSPLDYQNGMNFAYANSGGDVTPRGKLVLSSYDLESLEPLEFPDLSWVTFANVFRGGATACNRTSHFWYSGREMVGIDALLDRPASSYKYRLCCGHGVSGNLQLWVEAEIDRRWDNAAPNSAYNTTARVLEYDPSRRRVRPISKKLDLGWGGASFVVGSVPTLPVSPDTGALHFFWINESLRYSSTGIHNQDFGHWSYQFQPNSNELGSSRRNTEAAGLTPASWITFDSAVDHTTPYFTHPSLHGFEYTPVRMFGPRVEKLAEGGPTATLRVQVGGYDDTFIASEPSDRYQALEFGDGPNRTWSTALQAVLTSTAAGVDFSHWTPNLLPLTLEVLARRPLNRGLVI